MFPINEIVTPALKKNDLDDVPEIGKALTQGKSKFVNDIMAAKLHKEAIRAYLATTAYVDTQVGRLLSALDNSPYKDNTIVVFMSDHGFHLAEKNHWQKATLWEEATHCLMMFRAPGITKPNGICKRFVSLLDLYPTLAELNGLAPPNYLDGRSLVPLLENPDDTWKSTAITGICNKNKPEQAYLSIRHELGRYIQYNPEQAEFYDTHQDPHEWNNLIDHPEYSKVIEQLKKSLPNAIQALPATKRNKNKK
jgi:arylsulfatase A-like enzyme